MRVDGDLAARALTGALEHLVAASSEGWCRREVGAFAAVTMVPLPTLNAVLVEHLTAEPEAVERLLEAVAETGLPHCLQLRPQAASSLAVLASERRMMKAAEVPLMLLEDAASIAEGGPGELLIRELAPSEAELHVVLAAAGFEAPEEYFRQLMTPAALQAPGVRVYLGVLDGMPVATALGLTLGEWVSIFNVATLPAHRRRGYGAAVTARAVRDGTSGGARFALLQSTPAGHRVYRRLGFRTVDAWQCWLSPTS